MEFIKTSVKDIFIRFDPITKRAAVVDKIQLEQELGLIKQELSELPSELELIQWAKENYQGKNFMFFEERKAEIEKTLEEIGKISK